MGARRLYASEKLGFCDLHSKCKSDARVVGRDDAVFFRLPPVVVLSGQQSMHVRLKLFLPQQRKTGSLFLYDEWARCHGLGGDAQRRVLAVGGSDYIHQRRCLLEVGSCSNAKT